MEGNRSPAEDPSSPGERTREFVLSREREPEYLKAAPSRSKSSRFSCLTPACEMVKRWR